MSDVSEILTGRINLKRLTAYLLDGITPSYASLFDRDVARSSRLEVEIVGASIPVMGTVVVDGNGNTAEDEYIIQDRVLSTNWSLRMRDGVMSFDETSDAASIAPVFEDDLVPGTYWRMFIENGITGIEPETVPRNNEIILKDQVTLQKFRLTVSGGVLGMIPNDVGTEIFTFTDNGIKVGTIDFLNVTNLVCSGIVGGSIYVRAVSNLGQPINQLKSVYDDMPVRFYAQSGRIRMLKQGQDKIAKYKIMAEPDADVQDKDMVFTVSGCFGLTYGQIDFVEKFYDFDGVTHHTEAEIVDL